MKRSIKAEEAAWLPAPLNTALLLFLIVVYALIMTLFTSYTHNLDEIKPTMQFMLLPFGVVGFFALLYFGRAAPVPRKVWLPFGAFFLVLVVSSLLARHTWRAWFTVGYYWAMAVPFLLVPACIKDVKTFRLFVNAFVVIGLAIVLFGIFHFTFDGFGWLRDAMYPYRNPSRGDRFFNLLNTLSVNREMFSTILSTDFYGAYLVMLFPVAVSLVMAPLRTWWEPALGAVTAVLAAYSVLETGSNDSQGVILIIVFFYMGIFVIAGLTSAKKHNVLMLLAGGVLALVVTILYLYWWKLSLQIGSIMGAISARAIIYGGAWDMFLDHPIVGAGPGAFLLMFPLYRSPDYYEHEISNVTLYAHNMYLGLLAEEGLLGFLAFMAFLVVILYLGFRQILSPGSRYLRTHQVGLMAAIIGVSIQNFFSPNSRWTVCGINYWMLFGLSVSCSMLGMRLRDLGVVKDADEEAAEEGARKLKRPSADERLSAPVFPKWNRRVGMGGMVVAWVVAVGMFWFGICYWKAAVHNNRGIELITQAGPTVKSRPELGKQLYRAGISEFEEAIDWWPGFVTSYYKLAHAYSAIGQPLKALDTYRRLAEYAPDYSEIHRNYAIIYRQMAYESKDPDKQEEYWRKSLEANERAAKVAYKVDVQRVLAMTFMEAASMLTRAPEAEREDWRDRALEALYWTAMRRHYAGEDPKKMADIRQMLVKQLFSQARRLKDAEDPARRNKYLRWVVRLAQRLIHEDKIMDEETISRMVTAMQEMGGGDEAQAYIEQEIAENPTSLLYRKLLARFLVTTEEHAAASREYERLFHLSVNHKKADVAVPYSRRFVNRNRKDKTRPEQYLGLAIQEASRANDNQRVAALSEVLKTYQKNAKSDSAG